MLGACPVEPGGRTSGPRAQRLSGVNMTSSMVQRRDGAGRSIAVIGTGRVGRAVGSALAAAGYPVVYGSRRPGGDSIGVAEAVEGGDVVVVATPPDAAADLAREHGEALAGKLILDATNNVMGSPANASESFAEHAPKCRYVRAFNTLGTEVLTDPIFDGEPADMYFSCAQADRPAVDELITAVGLRPVYVGEQSYDLVDGVMRLWLTLAMREGHGRNMAFRMVTR
ncbi:NADPH-dependent F420 reductase [Nocardia sp. NPDC059240]|uniref:NADPH-dependent F420 reductase n=1 Tax=Nocardia sp. NPDC059240 TaxID=3346786 RepID=UPI0036B8CDFD